MVVKKHESETVKYSIDIRVKALALLAEVVYALRCTALHCTALHCTALHCTALQWPLIAL
jgi:hypothetical protein